MHFMNTILLLGAGAASMVSAGTTTQYLTLNGLNSNTPSGINTPAYNVITFPITDSKTKTSTTCTVEWSWTKKPSTSWTTCKDSTYAVKVSNYKDITDFTVALRHQYNKQGKKCANTNAKTCVTTTATHAITKSNAAFQSYCGASGACGAVSKKSIKITSSSKTGTQ